jgi:hypothetical protein
MLLAVIVVLVAVFFVATGRGGELSRERPDYAPLDLGPVSATDIALVRPPTALLGYNVKVTDEALDVIARAMRDRDTKIAYLQAQLAATTPETAQDPQLPVAPRPVSAPPNLQPLQVPGDLPAPQARPEPQDQDDTQILRALYQPRTPRTGPDEVAHEDDTRSLASYAALPSEAARPEGRPAEAGRPLIGEDPKTGQQRPAAEDNIVPWDEPAGQQDLPAARERPTEEHPEYRSDLTAGEGPTGSSAGE